MVAGADIGGGLYIAHPVGCTIVVESMGTNVSVMANVTTGRLQELRWPRIGDRVFIGAGARILGPISVGADAIVGANAVVINDVPVAATVVGIPARVAEIRKADVSGA
jgi:serine O-acetyltransferase